MLTDRIENMSDEWQSGNPQFDYGYERARQQAAQLAQEADELIGEMAEALENVNKLIAEGATHGFNYDSGDWAERLFHSQQKTSDAIKQYNQYKERNQ